MVVALASHECPHLGLQHTNARILFQLFFEVGGQLVGQAVLMELFETLEILNVALVALLVSKRRLAVDRGAVRYIALTEDSRVGLGQVLGSLDGGVSL